jgi:hypothetical protein
MAGGCSDITHNILLLVVSEVYLSLLDQIIGCKFINTAFNPIINTNYNFSAPLQVVCVLLLC